MNREGLLKLVQKINKQKVVVRLRIVKYYELMKD